MEKEYRRYRETEKEIGGGKIQIEWKQIIVR